MSNDNFLYLEYNQRITQPSAVQSESGANEVAISQELDKQEEKSLQKEVEGEVLAEDELDTSPLIRHATDSNAATVCVF